MEKADLPLVGEDSFEVKLPNRKPDRRQLLSIADVHQVMQTAIQLKRRAIDPQSGE